VDLKSLIIILYLLFSINTLISQEYIAAVQKDKKWGYIDEKGNWIIEPRLDKANDFNEGYAIIEINDTKHYVDVKGKLYGKPGEYEIFYNFSGGMARVRVGDYWGFIDTSFSIAIQPAYNNAKDFSEGIAAVKLGKVWGYIDKNGNWLIEPNYYFKANNFSEGFAIVEPKPLSAGFEFRLDVDEYIDINGKYFGNRDEYRISHNFSEGKARVKMKKDEKWGFIDTSFSVVIYPVFDDVMDFNDDIAPVRQGGKWGYINKKGEWLKEPAYDKAYKFRCGIAMVKIKKTWYFIDKDFNLISENKNYIVTHPFSNGLARVKVGKLWGYVNTDGEIVIEPAYKLAKDFKKISP